MVQDLKILITRRCNLDCEYCFAKNFRHNENEPLDMDYELFKSIIETCVYDGISHVNLLGGEPTQHPKFADMLYYLNSLNLEYTVLSNAIDLEELIPSLGLNASLLLNINSEENIGSYKYVRMMKTLDKLSNLGYLNGFPNRNSRATLGFNIYNKDECTVNNMLHMIDRYKPDSIRVSICSPINLNVSKQKYYEDMKETLLQITREGLERGIHFNCDCSMVPPCYFTAKELLILQQVWGDYTPGCGNICAVNTSGIIIPCFSNTHYEKMLRNKQKFLAFPNACLLEDYIKTATMTNELDMCNECPKVQCGCINGCGGCN